MAEAMVRKRKNPPWSRDELILALDLFIRHGRSPLAQRHPDVVELSGILSALPLHTDRPDAARFRNPNGVHMKLCNFLRLDPGYPGVGLSRGGRLEEDVWAQFASHPAELRKVAQAIIDTLQPQQELSTFLELDEAEFPEGRLLYRTHRIRERNAAAIRRAKAAAMARGRLSCQVCAFNFGAVYGAVGQGFIECHHTVPVSELAAGAKTRVRDLVLVCSNCHRMLHRRRPWLAADQLRQLVRRETGASPA